MKTLAEQVRIYMRWRSESSGRDFTAADLAQEVARHEKGVASASKCKRQDIEHLLKREIKTPRYIAALAAAMGTTVEVLKTGSLDVASRSCASTEPDSSIAPVGPSESARPLHAASLASAMGAYFAEIDPVLAPSAHDALRRFACGGLMQEDLEKVLAIIEKANRVIRADRDQEKKGFRPWW